jgi:hypothetical protein
VINRQLQGAYVYMNDNTTILFPEMQSDIHYSNTSASTPSGMKKKYNYRKSDKNGQKCKNCKHLTGFIHNEIRYYKCRLIGKSSSAATDIRLSNVCDRYLTD